MAKVKKTAAVTGVRNVKASKKSGRALLASSKTAKATGSGRKNRTAGRGSSGTKAKARRMSTVKSIAKAKAKRPMPAPVVRVSVKPLEPQAKCGLGTSVQYLFRVDETVDGRTTPHLVFFDRHGWYCEHGRNCPAVAHARKYQGHIARAS